MMKVKFLTHCRDAVTREHYLEGAVVNLPEARALGAIAKGHAEEILELDEPKPTKRKRGRPPQDKAAKPTEDK